MRRLFLLFAFLLALLIPAESVAGPFMVLPKRGSAWSGGGLPLAGWDYRKEFTATRESGSVTDYQVKILVGESSGATGEDVDCGGHVLSTFNDLRFTKADGTTLLPYWIESITGTTPNQLATVWVKLDSVGTSATTFYMYYGKSDASAYSSGADTFIFFDDFPGSSIDTDKWDVTGDGGITVSGSVAVLHATSTVTQVRLQSDVAHLKNNLTAARARLKTAVVNSDTGEVTFGTDEASGIYSHANINHRNYKFTYANMYNSNEHREAMSGPSNDTYCIFDFLRPGLASWYVDGGNNVQNSDYYRTDDKKIWFRADRNTADQTLSIDWILVRNHRATEPTVGSWGSEEGG